jgi:uncharacterized phiE125 gp8 family phage protein
VSVVDQHSVLITGPAFEPVTLAELKAHSIVEFSDDDQYLVDLLRTATAQVENDTARALVKQSWEVIYDCFPALIRLPVSPLLAVTSIKYYDTDGVQQTLAATEYEVLSHGIAGRITPAPTKSWPSTETGRLDAVTVLFDAGYIDIDGSGNPINDAPYPLKQAIMVLAAHLYENREIVMTGLSVAELPMSYKSLIQPYEVTAV